MFIKERNRQMPEVQAVKIDRIRIGKWGYTGESLKALSISIRKYGVIQPIVVRKMNDKYDVIAGRRRLLASKMAGLTEIPCMIFALNSAEADVVSLSENIQRKQIHFLDEARELERIMSIYGYSQEELARKLGYSQPTVANKVRLMRLSEKILYEIERYGLSERQARDLLRLEEGKREEAVRIIADNNLNVRQTAELIDKMSVSEGKAKLSGREFIIKDIRIFSNTIERGVKMLNSGGVEAELEKNETEDSITIRVTIKKEAPRRGTLHIVGE